MQCRSGAPSARRISQWSNPRLSNTCAEMSSFSCATIGKRDRMRVAMVPLPINSVAAVGDLPPYGIGDELVLRLAGPVVIAAGVAIVGALHLLQEQDVGGHAVQLLLQLVDDHAPGEVRETLVDVVSRDGEFHRRATGRKIVTAAMLAGKAGDDAFPSPLPWRRGRKARKFPVALPTNGSGRLRTCRLQSKHPRSPCL